MAAFHCIHGHVGTSSATMHENRDPSPLVTRRIVLGFGDNHCSFSKGNLSATNYDRTGRLVASAKKGFGSAILPSGPESLENDLVLENHGLSVEVLPDEKSRARLIVTVPTSICEYFWNKGVERIRKEVKSGSKNKANSESVLMGVYGSQEMKRAALEILMRETATETFAPVADRMISNRYSQHFVKSGDEMVADYDKSKPFTYEVSVDLYPEVTWKDERPYFGMEVSIKIDEADPAEEAEKELRALVREKGTLRVKEGSGLEMGDVGVMDMEAVRINEDGTLGEKILSCCQQGFTLDTESSLFMPGLVSGLLGLQRGASRTLALRFPPDWPLQALRGLSGSFHVTCTELFLRDLPPLEGPSSSAGDLVPGASSLAEARALLLQKHSELFREGMDKAVTLAVLDKLLELCEIEVPESMVLEDAQQLFMLHLAQVQAKYNPSPEELQQLSSEDQFQLFVRVQRQQCQARVRQALAIDAIYACEEGLQVTNEELEVELKDALSQFEGAEDQLSSERLKEQAFVLLKEKKVLAWLSENAQVAFTS